MPGRVKKDEKAKTALIVLNKMGRWLAIFIPRSLVRFVHAAPDSAWKIDLSIKAI